LINYGTYQTDFTFDQDWSYLQPSWDKSRLVYALFITMVELPFTSFRG
jgi:hypothetical protein